MKVTVVLEGSTDDVMSLVGMAIEGKLLVGLAMEERNDAEVIPAVPASPARVPFKRANKSVFRPGDRVHAPYVNTRHGMKKHDKGVVMATLPTGRGWGVSVRWNDSDHEIVVPESKIRLGWPTTSK